MMKSLHSYEDILRCHRPDNRRVKMTVAHRAKQFAPFAALKGYGEALKERERIV